MTGGAGLDDATLARLAGELAAHRDSLRAEIRAHGADPESDDIAFVDDAGFADRGHSSEERGHVIAVVRALRSNLVDVEHALAKIDVGTYGICERCGRPIGRDRLEAIPWAALGIDCKQLGGSG
jgi:RNA polymerase-binding transcription factor